MISREELQLKAGITRGRLMYLRQLRLIGTPQCKSTPGRGGKQAMYPDDSLRRIQVVQELQAQGMGLREIADGLRGEPTMTLEPETL